MPRHAWLAGLQRWWHRPDDETTRRNLLEILEERHVPSGAVVVLLAFLAALSLAPYLGGRTLWFFGTSAVQIPTVSERMFWIYVTGAPLVWTMVLSRVFGAPPTVWVRRLALGAILSASLFVAVLWQPSIGLDAIDPNFDEFVGVPGWRFSAQADGYDRDFAFFRTRPRPLPIAPGCALRVDSIDVWANGAAKVTPPLGGFDLNVFVSTHPLLPDTERSHEVNHQLVPYAQGRAVAAEPDGAEVVGRAVIVVRDDLAAAPARFRAHFDFPARRAEVAPEEHVPKKLERRDVLVPHDGTAQIQLGGWTLWGSPALFELTDPLIRISGKQHCGPTLAGLGW